MLHHHNEITSIADPAHPDTIVGNLSFACIPLTRDELNTLQAALRQATENGGDYELLAKCVHLVEALDERIQEAEDMIREVARVGQKAYRESLDGKEGQERAARIGVQFAECYALGDLLFTSICERSSQSTEDPFVMIFWPEAQDA